MDLQEVIAPIIVALTAIVMGWAYWRRRRRRRGCGGGCDCTQKKD